MGQVVEKSQVVLSFFRGRKHDLGQFLSVDFACRIENGIAKPSLDSLFDRHLPQNIMPDSVRIENRRSIFRQKLRN